MSDNKSQLQLDLDFSQKQLSERTRERDEVQLKLVRSDERLFSIEQALVDTNSVLERTEADLTVSAARLESRELELAQQAAKLAMTAVELAQKSSQLRKTDASLFKRTVELENANLELKAMMQQREDFVAALTHDLKSPLLSSTKILEFLVKGQIPVEKQTAIFNELLESHREMLRMIFNLLDVYRHESGKLVPLSEEVDVRALVHQCLEQFSFNVAEKQLHVSSIIDDDIHIVKTDDLFLRRILTNLLSNAVKFSRRGGPIIVRAFREPDLIKIAVKDSGPGMSIEQQARIFERFCQTLNSRENGGVGTGLGLFLSRELATTLGGSLTFVSDHDVGSEFTLTLPDR